MEQETNKQLESRQQAVLEMNEVISNSLGLYRTGVEQADGIHDLLLPQRQHIG